MSERAAELEAMTPEEQAADRRARAQKRIDLINATPGNLKDGYATVTARGANTPVEGDGYDCPLCMNRGYVMSLEEVSGALYERCTECRCMEVRRSIWRMRASGLEKSIRDCTFRRFEAREPWQKAMLETAQRYLQEGVKEGKWLFLGGQPGCGKTHLCTAVAGKLLYEMPVYYIVWPEESSRLKAVINDADEYGERIGRLKTAQVLYIDDFFKRIPGPDGRPMPPTAADVRLAFELLNHRYINRLPTILSSEAGLEELTELDEATGSRIAERSRGYNMMIGRDRSRNWRLQGGRRLSAD